MEKKINNVKGIKVMCEGCNSELQQSKDGSGLVGVLRGNAIYLKTKGEAIGEDETPIAFSVGGVGTPVVSASVTPSEVVAPTSREGKRLAAFAKAGVDVSNFDLFTKKNGEQCIVRYDEDGFPIVVPITELDEIEQKILQGGWVRNPRLQPRFMMAQFEKGERYGGASIWDIRYWRDENGHKTGDFKERRVYGSTEGGYVAWIKSHGYWYQAKHLRGVLETMVKLDAKSDKEAYAMYERAGWDKETVYAFARHTIKVTKSVIDRCKVRRSKNGDYKRLPGAHDVFVKDINERILQPMERLAESIYKAKTIKGVLQQFNLFMKSCKVKMRSDKFCREWMDAFKGLGGYRIMMNLITGHGCNFKGSNGRWLTTEESVKHLENLAEDCRGEGYRMIGILRDFKQLNGFDFYKKMEEKYAGRK